MDCILFIGGGRDTQSFINSAKKQNFYTIGLDISNNCYCRQDFDKFIQADTHCLDGISQIVEKLQYSFSINLAFTYSSSYKSLETTSNLNTSLGLKTYSLETLGNLRSKSDLKKILTNAGISTPQYLESSDREDFYNFLDNSKSFIIKPSGGSSGSLGVSKENEESKIKESISRAQILSDDGKVIVEEFIEGTEFSIDGFVVDGVLSILSIKEKRILPNINFIIDGFITPKDLNCFDELVKLTGECIEALKLDFSFFSLDIIAKGDKLFVVDFGPLMDCKIDRLLNFEGIKVQELFIQSIARNLKSGPINKDALVYSKNELRFIYSNKKGILQNLYDSEIPGTYFEWEKEIGDEINPPISVADSLGWFIGPDEELQEIFERKSNLFKIS